jgi:hypothetical protein
MIVNPDIATITVAVRTVVSDPARYKDACERRAHGNLDWMI